MYVDFGGQNSEMSKSGGLPGRTHVWSTDLRLEEYG